MRRWHRWLQGDAGPGPWWWPARAGALQAGWRWWVLGGVVAVGLAAGLLTAAWSGESVQPAAAAARGDQRMIWLAAVEYKGGAQTSVEPFPTGAPPGPGIKLVPADPQGRWETEVYRWDPGTVAVHTGERVRLRIWGVHGKEHPAWIEGHDVKFTVRRGRMTEVEFQAGAPGIYRIVCDTHAPTMTAQLLVLPRP